MTAPVRQEDFIDAKAARQELAQRFQLLAIVALAVFERAVCWFRRPPDMGLFLEPWFAHLVHYGPIQAFAHPFSNYEPAYLYLLAAGSLAHDLFTPMSIIKMLSVLGTLFLTFAMSDLLKSVGADRRGALLVLILPSVALNDGLFAQCDALWAGSAILALAALIRGNTLRSMAWCGVAIAFKAQSAFVAPVIVGAMIGRRVPWWQWMVPAAVFLASLIPPWLMGWPGMKLLTVYLGQASLDQLAGRLANPWMIGTIYGEQLARQWFVLGYAAAGVSAAIIAALAARNWRDGRLLILLAAMAGTALPFLLPKMLERYYFLGDVMTLALALSMPNKLTAFAVRAVQIASIFSLFTYIYFFHDPWPALAGAGFAAAGLVAMCRLAAPSFRSLLADFRPGRLRARPA